MRAFEECARLRCQRLAHHAGGLCRRRAADSRAASTSVTLLPSRRCACASSQPIGPPPMTSRCGGTKSLSKIVSLVKILHLAQPRQRRHGGARSGGDDEAARADALAAGLDRARRRRIARARGSPCSPALRSAPANHWARSGDHLAHMAMDRGAVDGGRRPRRCRSARRSRIVCAIAAAASSALDGTQPVLRQSPPISPSSISTVLRPSWAAPAATRQPGRTGPDDADIGLDRVHAHAAPLRGRPPGPPQPPATARAQPAR